MTQRTRSANLGGTVITSTGVVLASGLDISNQSNAAYQQANTARDTANSAFNNANNAFNQANTARSDANATFATINSTFGTVNTSITNAHNQANAARSDANTTFATVNSTFSSINSTFGTVNTAITNAHNQANSAFAAANLRLSTSGGSISGDLAITGNLTVQGNATTINVSNLSVNDSMILLSTNAVGDSNDIGFIGHFDRGATATHAGLIRKATQNQFYLFDNYEVEPSNNVIDVAGNNFRVGNLRLGIINANSFVTSAGLDVTGQANAAYTQANAARSDANTTFATINTTFGTINTNIGTAYTQANNAFAAANNRVLKAGDTMTGQLNISSGGLLVTGTAQATYFYGLAAGTNDSANFGNSQSNLRIGGNGSHVTLNAAPWGFNLVAGSGSGATALYVNSSGNVMIGTTSASVKFQVSGAATIAGGVITLGSSATEYVRFGLYGTLLSTDTHISHNQYWGGSSWQFFSNTIPTSSIRLGTSTTANIEFLTGAANTQATTKMTIDVNGNVGIGTTSPGTKLHVVGIVRSNNTLGIIGSGGSKTLAVGEIYVVTSAGQTITLPASPSAGDTIAISVGNFTNTVVGRNGQNIMGLAEDMTIDTAYAGFKLVFVDATYGWRIV